MKCTTRSITCFLAALSILLLCSCANNDTQAEAPAPTTDDLIAEATAAPTPPAPAQLPVRYQNPGFITTNDLVDKDFEENQEFKIKVGANIRSTRGPQPLWDILKRLASLKGMSVSWSSDVNQDVLVDVDIKANDDYYEAIDNLLRQVDYFHEIKDQSIIVKYKETKTYHVAMPFTHQTYETAVGGNILGSAEEASSIEGTIRLDSRENEFDIWKNIQENLDQIIATWSTSTSTPESAAAPAEGEEGQPAAVQASRQTSDSGNSYTIDKPVGLVTVHAPRPLQEKINSYLDGIEHELYKQISIEAKIVEVQLNDYSSLGINWNTLLNSISLGPAGIVGSSSYGKNTTDSNDRNSSLEGERNSSSLTSVADGVRTTESSLGENITTLFGAATTAATIITGGASNAASGTISLAAFNFTDFIHALSEQGNTSILANPKLSVMNGQPALITAGRNVTYIDSIDSSVEGTGDNSRTTYTVETARILSGVGLSLTAIINNDNEIILNLVPVTSVLEEPIEYRDVGLGQVGLPIVNIREMSTMVKVQDGEMLVVGGLISSVESTRGNNLFPGLQDVPVLKYLTGYEEKVMVKRELIILLRPRIL